MKINKDTVLVGEKVALVPYLPVHVPVRIFLSISMAIN